jgi:hypothetical protein
VFSWNATPLSDTVERSPPAAEVLAEESQNIEGADAEVLAEESQDIEGDVIPPFGQDVSKP